MSGVGKTEIAIEYAYSFGVSYDYVFWVRAGSRQSVRSDLIRVASAMLEPDIIGRIIETNRGDVHDGEDAILERLAKELFNAAGTGLFVFDDVNEPEELDEFIAMCANAPRLAVHIFITSCSQSIQGAPADNSIEVTAMTTDEAMDFLECRLLKYVPTRMEERITSWYSLVQLFGGLPLALEHAAAYIRTTQCTVTQYIELFEQDDVRKELLYRTSGDIPINRPLRERPISLAWEVSLRNLEKHYPSSVSLFNVMAFLDGSGISDKLLMTGFCGLAELPSASLPTSESILMRLRSPLIFTSAIAQLLSFSFIRRLDNSLWIHPLLRIFGKDRLMFDERHYWADLAIKVLHHALVSVEYNHEIYVRHADVCIENAERYSIDIPELSAVRAHAEWGYDLSHVEMKKLSEGRSLDTWRGSMSSHTGSGCIVDLSPPKSASELGSGVQCPAIEIEIAPPTKSHVDRTSRTAWVSDTDLSDDNERTAWVSDTDVRDEENTFTPVLGYKLHDLDFPSGMGGGIRGVWRKVRKAI